MDLNELLHRHQISLMCAGNASCTEARIAHQGLAHLYEGRVHAMRGTRLGDAPLTLAVHAI